MTNTADWGVGEEFTAILCQMALMYKTIKMFSSHLNTGLVWYLNGIFVPCCQMVRYSNGGLKNRLKKPDYGPKCKVSKVM